MTDIWTDEIMPCVWLGLALIVWLILVRAMDRLFDDRHFSGTKEGGETNGDDQADRDGGGGA